MEVITDNKPGIVTVNNQMESSLSVLDQKKAHFIELVDKYQGLTIDGVDDTEGYNAVHEARMALKKERVQLKKDGEELRENAVKFSKKVIERVDDLTSIILPLEKVFEVSEKEIDKLKEEARQQKEMLEAKVLQERLNALNAYNFAADYLEVKHMSDDQFDEMLAHAKSLHEVELQRKAEAKAEEDRKRQEEDLRLQVEREQLAKQRAEQEARERELQRQEQERIEAERKRQEDIRIENERIQKEHAEQLAAIKADRERLELLKRNHEEAVRLEEARKEAAERAKLEEQARVKREAEEKAEDERLAKIEAERQEALKPDKEKLIAFGQRITDLIFKECPGMTRPETSDVLEALQIRIDSAVQRMYEVIVEQQKS